MSYRVSPLSGGRIAEMVYDGALSGAELVASAHEVVALAASLGTSLILADARLLAGGHSIVDLFGLADSLAADSAVRQLKEAVVVPALPEAAGTARFWETTGVNRGLTIRLFDDRETAIAWLLG